jgi:hypothetical protein
MIAHGENRNLLAGFGQDLDAASSSWRFFEFGSYKANDGIVSIDGSGVCVRAGGSDPVSGAPMFQRTVSRDCIQGGLPATLDHVKWLAYAKATASSGLPGFDAPERGELTFEAELGVTCFGVDRHPFGALVADPNDDLRLACGAMNLLDYESFMVFDFFLTNRSIYAFYERLPFARHSLGNYAAFSYAVKVGNRQPGATSKLGIQYNRGRGEVRWILEGRQVMFVDHIGLPFPQRRNLRLDAGGRPEGVRPRQLACGFGLMTILDFADDAGTGLVRLSSAENEYFDPLIGEPHPARFYDDESRDDHRLFGQGALINVKRYQVRS